MKITGVIAEYNPFHNGHKFQIEQIKKESDAVVCVMSGNFVQRGDIAITDKWTRTKMALSSGVDLVVELPVCYALNTAERFAFGAVSLMDKMGVIDELHFGSETGEIAPLIEASKILNNEPETVSLHMQSLLKEGLSYPVARERAFADYISTEILSQPNNVLAVEYIKALLKIDSKIIPNTIKRNKVKHDEQVLHGAFASASMIRQRIKGNKNVDMLIPTNAYQVLDVAINNKNAPYCVSSFDMAIIMMLRMSTKEQLALIQDVTEGLENRILSCARNCSSLEKLAHEIKTKRYPLARIRRVLLSALLGLTSDLGKSEPGYIRVLGMTDVGKNVLSQIKLSSDLPIVTKVADFRMESKMFEKDILATDLYSLCCPDENKRISGLDYKTSPVIFR